MANFVTGDTRMLASACERVRRVVLSARVDRDPRVPASAWERGARVSTDTRVQRAFVVRLKS